METLGGHLSAEDVVVSLEELSTEFTINAEDLDISALSDVAGIDGLKVSGILSGVIPIAASPESLKISEARLTSVMPGVVRYRPEPAPAGLANSGGGSLLLEALDNFEYDNLAVLMNGDAQKEMQIDLLFQGRNPNLYNGYPITFTLKLDGRLFEIARSGLSGYRLPQTLENNIR